MTLNRQTQAVNLIVRLEGFRIKAYQDTSGIWTIGVGCTVYPDGIHVKDGDTCDIIDAKLWLMHDLSVNVFPLLREYTDVPDSVYVALCSFVYNIGHLGVSIKKAIDDKNWNELATAFRLYIYDKDGNVDEGLKNRREIEIKYMMGGI